MSHAGAQEEEQQHHCGGAAVPGQSGRVHPEILTDRDRCVQGGGPTRRQQRAEVQCVGARRHGAVQLPAGGGLEEGEPGRRGYVAVDYKSVVECDKPFCVLAQAQ